MRVRDGPAAVRGDAPPPRSHWREPGRRRGREPRVRRPVALLHNRTPRGRRIQVLRSSSSRRRTARGGRSFCTSRGASGGAAAPTAVPGHDHDSQRQGHGHVQSRAASSRCRRRRPSRCSRSAPGARSSRSTTSPTTRRAAPKTTLSGFTPNVEAIASYRPDLVVIAFDTKGLAGALRAAGHQGRPPRRREDAGGRVPADPPARARHGERRARDACRADDEDEDRPRS